MKKYLVEWTEMVTNNCFVEIDANSKEEALAKWKNGEYEDYEKDFSSNSFETPYAKEIMK